jgi:ADP-ribosylglycohydrolase
MLLEIAIGDAYGAGFEFSPKEVILKHNNLQQYHPHQKYTSLKPGSYTDDTQMSLAITELLLDKKEWTPYTIASKFLEVFKRDPREGYASGFFALLNNCRTPKEFIDRIVPFSEKNGAAMRASPIGFLPNISDVIKYSKLQAQLTHNTAIGIDSAIASSLISYYFFHSIGNKQELGRFIERLVPSILWSQPWVGIVETKGDQAVHAAITIIQNSHSLSEILLKSVDLGGDVDTVAAIAMAGASCSKEIEKDIPWGLIENLENNTYGRDYLLKLDQKLFAKFGGKNVQ